MIIPVSSPGFEVMPRRLGPTTDNFGFAQVSASYSGLSYQFRAGFGRGRAALLTALSKPSGASAESR
jgi:hypothetical protein